MCLDSLDLLEDHCLAERARAVEVLETGVRRSPSCRSLPQGSGTAFCRLGAAEGSLVTRLPTCQSVSRLSICPDTVSLYFSTNDLMECFWRWLPSLMAYSSAKKVSIFSEGDEIVGHAGADEVFAGDPGAGQAQVHSEVVRQSREEVPADTSVKKPIFASGIANMLFSVAMRKGEWMESPTPPPMTMPSHIDIWTGFMTAVR
jgi:hypothetical protein